MKTKITYISAQGVWLLYGDKELFMSYENFPWFKGEPIEKILNVEDLSPGHFHWPDLDIDLNIERIIHPERFPLKAKKV